MDFGQELVTSVHRPIKWSDARPNDAEFKLAFAQTRISAQRIFDFVKKRHRAVRRLVLLNSEGYWSGEWKSECSPSSPSTTACVTSHMALFCITVCNAPPWCPSHLDAHHSLF